MSIESPSFHRFQEDLAQKISVAHKMGASDKDLASMTKHIAEWLEERQQPKSPEQQVLKELWQSADNRQQEVLSQLLLKMVERHHSQTQKH